jgi:hypothetical protein
VKTSEFLHYYKHKAFNDYWNYNAITNGCIFHSNGDITAIVKAYITKIDEPDVIDEINRKILDFFEILPFNTEVSFYLNRIPDQDKIIVRGGPKKKIVHYLNQKRETFFNTNQNMITVNHIAITFKNTELRQSKKSLMDSFRFFNNNRFSFTPDFVADKLPILNNSMDKLINLFVDDKGISYSSRLTDQELVQFISLLINHQVDPFSASLNDVFNGDFVMNRPEGNYFYNGQYHAFLSIRKRNVPRFMDDDFTVFLYNEEITQVPFTVNNTVILKDKEKELDNIQSMRSFAEAMMGIPGFKKRKLQFQQEINNFAEIEYVCREEKLRIVETSWNLHLWAETPDRLEFIKNQFQTIGSANGFIFTHETGNMNCALQSFFPGMASKNRIKYRMLSGNAKCLFPVMSTPIITPNPKSRSFVYFYNKYGDIVKYDTFDSRCTNWNFLIVGSSGSGKSFFTNQLLFQQLPASPKILIVDKGGSYKRLIENLNGTYIAVSYDNTDSFSINFFDGGFSQEKEIFLIAMLEQMIIDKSSQYISKSYKAVFQQMIKQAYTDTGDNAGDVLSLDYFVERYMMMNEVTRPLVAGLQMYIKNGSYAAFFKRTKIQKSFEHVCFDLDGLGNNKDIMPIIALAVVNLIWQSIITDIERRKIIVIDEAWAALKDSSGLADFIDEIFRTARKHNGCIGLVTQSLRDILQSSLGAGIKTNTSFFYVLRNKDDAQTLVQIEDLNQHTFENKIKKLQFVKGKYSELYMHAPGVFKDVLRVRPCMSDYWASTTDAGDKMKMKEAARSFEKEHQRKPSMEEVIETLINH